MPIRFRLKYGQGWAPSAHIEGIVACFPGCYARMTLRRMLRSNAMAVGMYEHFGFRVLRAISVPVVNVRMVAMVRDPQTS